MKRLGMAFLYIALGIFHSRPNQAQNLSQPKRGTGTVDGCELLKNPSRYYNRTVKIRGLITIGLEREDLTFDCKGYVSLTTSFTEYDRKTYGFLTEKKTLFELHDFANSPRSDGKPAAANREIEALVIGQLRCHSTKAGCREADIYGALTIIAKHIEFDEPTSSPH